MRDLEAAHDDTELTGEEREAMSSSGAVNVGGLLKALEDAVEKPRKERSESAFHQLMENFRNSPAPAFPDRDDSLLKSMRLKADRERAEVQRRLDDSENFRLMAEILVQMDQERKDNQEARRKQTIFNTFMAMVGALLALGGIIVPFIIEGIKGWK